MRIFYVSIYIYIYIYIYMNKNSKSTKKQQRNVTFLTPFDARKPPVFQANAGKSRTKTVRSNKKSRASPKSSRKSREFIKPKVNASNEELKKYVRLYFDGEKNKLPEHLRNIRIGLWDVEEITDMSNLFINQEEFNEDISEWNVSNVTNMNGMFAMCEKFNQDISKWNVSKVTDMSEMFEECKQFNSELNDWDVSNVTNMDNMFDGCTSFNKNLNDWDVSNVVEMFEIFGRNDDENTRCKISINYVKNWEPKSINPSELDEDDTRMIRESYIIDKLIFNYHKLSEKEKNNLAMKNKKRRLAKSRKEAINAFETIDQDIDKVSDKEYQKNLSKFIYPDNFNTRELLSYID